MKFSDEDSVGTLCEALLALSVAEKGYQGGVEALGRALNSVDGGFGFGEPIEMSDAIACALTAMGGADGARAALQRFIDADGANLQAFVEAQAAAIHAVVEGRADADATVARVMRVFHQTAEDRGGLTPGPEADALGEDQQTAEDQEDTLS